MRLTSAAMGYEHHVAIPAHAALSIGTLSSILAEVAAYLKKDKNDLALELFG